MRKLLLSQWTACLTLIFLLIIRLYNPVFVESIRLRYFDTLISSQPIIHNNIVVANIDEQAIDTYGQWPFKRDVFANIIENLYNHGAGLVIWDILMPEPDRLGGDNELLSTLTKFPVILVNSPSYSTKNIPKASGATIINSQFSDRLVNYGGIIANIPSLENAAAGVGSTNTLPEIDGINRRLPLVISAGHRIYPSLPLETLRLLANSQNFQVKLTELGIDKLRIAKVGTITTDQLGRIWIDWSQGYRTISITQIPDNLNGALVIVGASAAGISNPVATSIGAVYPQALEASVIATLIKKVNILRPSWALATELSIIFITGIIVLLVSRWTWSFIPTILGIISSHLIALYLYSRYHYLFDITAFVFIISMVYIHAYTVKFVQEYLQKKQIKKQFEHYLSPAMVKKLAQNPELLKLGGDTRQLTLLFCDIRGFTQISEQYKSNPQELTRLINRFLTPMTDIIMNNNGTIDKYMGDCIMAFWNAPLNIPDQQDMAVKSAVEMIKHLRKLNNDLTKEGLLPISIGIGINSGDVVVGNMGSNQRFDYSCLGDAVNLASRLEGQSKDYGVKIVVGENTVSKLSSIWVPVELDNIAVKGKKEGVKIYTIIARPVDSRPQNLISAAEQHKKFIDAYRTQRWDRASILAKSLTTAWEGELKDYYKMMINRIDNLKSNPPGSNWDTIYRATSK